MSLPDQLLQTIRNVPAAISLIEKLEGKVVATAFVIELEALVTSVHNSS